MYIVVVPLKENRRHGATSVKVEFKPGATAEKIWEAKTDASGIVADVLEIQEAVFVTDVVAAVRKVIFPHRSQSPAVKLIDVKFVAAAVNTETAEAAAITLETNSPTYPVPVLLFVAVPTMPFVVGLKATLPKVTSLVVAISCGVLRVTFPTPGVTVIWLAVPMMLPETTPPIKAESWVTVSL